MHPTVVLLTLPSTTATAISILFTASLTHTVPPPPSQFTHNRCGPGGKQAGPDALLNMCVTVTLAMNRKQDHYTVARQDDSSGEVASEIRGSIYITKMYEETGQNLMFAGE